MNYKKILLLHIWAIFILFSMLVAGRTGEDAELYSLARKAGSEASYDQAFIYCQSLLTNYPNSKYKEQSIFGMGEYYFLVADYLDAQNTFETFINQYPKSKGVLFAQVYLYKIATLTGNKTLKKKTLKEIVSLKRMIFVFREFKEFNYQSALLGNYRGIYSINKIEIYNEGKLVEQIPY